MDTTNQPGTVFEQRRRQLCRRDHFLDILVRYRRAAFAARRITDGDNGKRMWIRESKQCMTGFAATDLYFSFNQAGVFSWLFVNRILRRSNASGEQYALFDRLVPLFRVWERIVPLPLGLSLIGIGRTAMPDA